MEQLVILWYTYLRKFIRRKDMTKEGKEVLNCVSFVLCVLYIFPCGVFWFFEVTCGKLIPYTFHHVFGINCVMVMITIALNKIKGN